jgi:aqualysin 1
MKYILILAVALMAVAAAVSVHTPRSSAQKGPIGKAEHPVPDRYIVVVDENAVGGDAAAPAVEAHGQFLSSLYGGSVIKVYSNALKGIVIEMTSQQAEALNTDPSVKSVEEDGFIYTSATQTSAPWHLDRVDQRPLPLDTAFTYTADGVSPNVYILDTGIRYTHVDFGGRADAVFDIINDGQNGNDCNGHGTHVAGIVGSATYGVAKNARLHAVRLLQCDGSGQISDLITGIDWVTANHVSPAVANISLTAAGISSSLETAVSNSIASGVVYSIAAGNYTADACGFTPARTPNAITVGATSDTDIRPAYSNYGTCVDLFAPGHNITSLSNGSDTGIRSMSGTSMASPVVAGVAALYMSANPTASSLDVINAVRSSATGGVITLNETTSPNLLVYSYVTAAPTPTPSPSPITKPVVRPKPTTKK